MADNGLTRELSWCSIVEIFSLSSSLKHGPYKRKPRMGEEDRGFQRGVADCVDSTVIGSLTRYITPLDAGSGPWGSR